MWTYSSRTRFPLIYQSLWCGVRLDGPTITLRVERERKIDRWWDAKPDHEVENLSMVYRNPSTVKLRIYTIKFSLNVSYVSQGTVIVILPTWHKLQHNTRSSLQSVLSLDSGGFIAEGDYNGEFFLSSKSNVFPKHLQAREQSDPVSESPELIKSVHSNPGIVFPASCLSWDKGNYYCVPVVAKHTIRSHRRKCLFQPNYTAEIFRRSG
jgi:hypothetical protein